MRVLALNDEPTLGGAAQLFRRTNDILRRAGHAVIEVTGRDLETDSSVAEASPPLNRGIRAWTRSRLWRLRQEVTANVRQVYSPRLARHLTDLLKRTPVDLAHVHNLHSRLSTHVFSVLRRLGVPIVYQVNDYYFFCNTYTAYTRRLNQPCKRCIHGNVFWAVRYGCVGGLDRPRADRAMIQAITRLALRAARPWRHVDLFLVTSEQAARLLEEWGISRERQHRLFNAMVGGEFPTSVEMGEEVVFYGTGQPHKGVETFLAALEAVDPSCRIGVYLAGMTPDDRMHIEALAARRGLQVRVDPTLRWGRGLQERLAAARAIVVPSQWWTTSENVVYEAMLFGKPVVVSRIGGNVELVEHGRTGFLFEPRNGRELAMYINQLARDADLASRLGAEALRRSRERFAEPAFLAQLEAAYARAIGRDGTP